MYVSVFMQYHAVLITLALQYILIAGKLGNEGTLRKKHQAALVLTCLVHIYDTENKMGG